MLLTSKPHDNEPDTSHDSDPRNLLGRRSDRNHSFNVGWPTQLGKELLDLLPCSLNLDAVVRVELWPKAFKPFDRSHHMNEHQRNAEGSRDIGSGPHVPHELACEVDGRQNKSTHHHR